MSKQVLCQKCRSRWTSKTQTLREYNNSSIRLKVCGQCAYHIKLKKRQLTSTTA